MKKLTKEHIRAGLAAEGVAVTHKEMNAIDFQWDASLSSVYDFYAYLISQIIEQPYIMIADKPHYTHAAVGKTGKRSEKTHIATRHNSLVLEPVIKYIAEQKQIAGIVFDTV